MRVAYAKAIILAIKEINRSLKLKPSIVFVFSVLRICGIKQTMKSAVAVHPRILVSCNQSPPYNQ